MNFNPHYAPFEGGCQLEWNFGDDYFEIEFKETGVTYLQILDGVETTGELSSHTLITEFLAKQEVRSEPTDCGRKASPKFCDVCLINDVEHSTDGYPDHTERCNCLCHKENVIGIAGATQVSSKQSVGSSIPRPMYIRAAVEGMKTARCIGGDSVCFVCREHRLGGVYTGKTGDHVYCLNCWIDKWFPEVRK